jgi:hypothetical protein
MSTGPDGASTITAGKAKVFEPLEADDDNVADIDDVFPGVHATSVISEATEATPVATALRSGMPKDASK